MIAQRVSFAFFNNLVVHGLGFVSLFFVARYMGPEPLGTIAFALAYLHIFSSFSSLGFGSAHIKRVSEGRDFGKCNGTYFSVKLVLTLLMTVVVLLTILIPKLSGHADFVSKEHETVLYVMLVSAIVGNVSMMFNITFGARREIAKQQIPKLAEKLVTVIGSVFVAITGLGVVLLAGANLLGSLIALLFFLYFFRGYPIARPDKEYFRSYVKFAIPVMFIGILSDLAHNMDKVMIQFFWTTADVGYYSAAERISVILTYIVVASETLIFPTISAYHARHDIMAIRSLANRAERYLSMIFSPILAFLFVFSHQVCTIILGQEFAQSAPLLVILVAVVLVNGTALPYGQQIGATNRIVLAAKLSSVIFVLDLLLNVIFVPKEFMGLKFLGLGTQGAALSTLLSMTIGSILFRIYAYRITASRPNTRILLHFISAFIMYLALRLISSMLPEMPVYYLLLCGILGIAIYLAVLTLFGEFGRADVLFFRKIMSPTQLKKYAVSEIKSGYEEHADRVNEK